jgi:hypothetical protein
LERLNYLDVIDPVPSLAYVEGPASQVCRGNIVTLPAFECRKFTEYGCDRRMVFAELLRSKPKKRVR